ncbi:MAG: lysostaphin resistance A-like protein [Eubacteriales bacterium]
MTSKNRRWEYSDENHVKGYRSAARRVTWLALGMFLSMYIIYIIALFVVIAVKMADTITPELFFGADPYTLQELINNVITQIMSDEILMNSLTIIVSLMSVAVPLLMYRVMRKHKLNLLKLFKPAMPKKAPLAVVLALGIGYLSTYVALLLFTLLSGIGINVLTPELPFPSTTAGAVLYFIGVAIVAPIVEEVMFRGVMLNELKPYGSTAAIVITSLLFGFIHGTPYAFFYATAIGLIFAYITIKTGSIFYSVITHMVFNSVSFVLQYLGTVTPQFEASLINSGFEVGVFLVSALFLIWLVRSNYDLSLPSTRFSTISKHDFRAGLRRPVVIVFFALTLLTSLTQFSVR